MFSFAYIKTPIPPLSDRIEEIRPALLNEAGDILLPGGLYGGCILAVDNQLSDAFLSHQLVEEGTTP